MDEAARTRVREYFQRRPAAMTLMAAEELGVPEGDVLEIQGAVPLRADALEAMLAEIAGWGRCHVIVSNRGATLEARGEFGGFSKRGPFLNVETPTLDMHLRPGGIARAFCFDKKGHMDGKAIHTVQFFDAQGASVFKVVLIRDEAAGGYTPAQEAAFEAFRGRHTLPA